MTLHEVRRSGHEALLLASELRQRGRLADPMAGIWEASDLQWWTRKPRRSDDVEQRFWLDDGGPLAAVYLTEWNEGWQCDLLRVPHPDAPSVDVQWAAAQQHLDVVGGEPVEVPVRDDEAELRALVEAAGYTAGDGSFESWMRAVDVPDVVSPADGYVVVDRSERLDRVHPMAPRNGEHIAEHLERTPLYDPTLDLAVETTDGEVAAYSLYWFDPVTKVGLVEPVRTLDDHQRRGLARAMISEGVNRLVAKGAERLKIGYESEAAGALYTGLGFVTGPYSTWYASPRTAG